MNQHFCNPAASVDPSQQISIFLFPSPDQYCQLSVKIIRRNSCKTISAAQLRSWQYKYINVTIYKYIVIFLPCLEKKLCLFWHSLSHILFQNPPLLICLWRHVHMWHLVVIKEYFGKVFIQCIFQKCMQNMNTNINKQADSEL